MTPGTGPAGRGSERLLAVLLVRAGQPEPLQHLLEVRGLEVSWVCGGCRKLNFTATPPCVFCGNGVAVDLPEWFKRDVITPASEAERDAVRVAQRALRLTPTGEMDYPTQASLRGTQRLYGLEVTGILDAATAVVIDGLRPYQLQEDA